MALNAHLEQEADANTRDDARGAERRALFLEASGELPGGANANVVIHNISVSGLLLETEERLSVEERIVLDLPEAGRCGAMVVWQSGVLYGCAFEETLDQRALAGLRLRADPAVVPSGMPFEAPDRRVPGHDVEAPIESPPEPLGVRLNRLRRDRGMTLAQVADALGVSKPTVWAWEKGKARPLPDRIEPIAEVLGVEAGDLADRQTGPQHSPLVEECRLRIATAYGTHPSKIRIMIEV